MTERDDFLALPHARRQLIVVVDDPEAKRGGIPAWVDLAASAVPGGGAATQAVRLAERAREAGIDALSVSGALADGLTFPPGHPHHGVLYAAHPVAEGTYYPAAQFHRLTFEHKLAEAVRLLMGLGAELVEVQHEAGWSRSFAAQLDLGLPKGTGSGAGSGERSHSSAALFRARLESHGAPHVPEDLAWYPHEPTWQQLAAGRLHHGLREFELTIRYDDDLGVNAALRAAAERARLDLGGRFEGHEHTLWRVVGRFGTA